MVSNSLKLLYTVKTVLEAAVSIIFEVYLLRLLDNQGRPQFKGGFYYKFSKKITWN